MAGVWRGTGRSRGRWAGVRPLLLAWLLLAAAFGGGDAMARYDAGDVTAAMLVKLASFIRWPTARSLDAKSRPLQIIVHDDADLAARLKRLYADGTEQGRPVRVQSRKPTKDDRPHIVFIGCERGEELPSLLAQANKLGALTVSRCRGFGERGVAVNFYQDDNRIRFEVNEAGLKRAGLRASYQLLSLARIVGGGRDR